MAYEFILSERFDGIGLITLNRPEKLNALSFPLVSELDDALTRFENDDEVKAVVLTGAGERAFSAGADIHEMAGLSGEELAQRQAFRGQAAVGASGVAVHFLTLYLALLSVAFPIAQALATVAAMTSNFALNNFLTYRDRRLTGLRFFVGLASFYAVCSLGAVANVGIASAALAHHFTWWMSGLAGAAVGVVWNYAVSSVVTWSQR